MNIKSLLKSKITQNAGWLVAGRVIQMAISFVVSIWTRRFLGPGNMGIIDYAGAYTGFFTALCTLGINSVIVKELVDHKDDQETVLGTAALLRGVASFLSALMIISVVSVVDAGEPLTLLVVSLCSIGLIFNVLEIFNYWFQSRLQSKVTAIAALTGYVLTSLYRLYLLMTQRSVEWFALATSLDYVCVGIILIFSYHKNGGKRLKISFSYGKELLSRSCHFILPSLMVAIYGQTDKIMLKQMISDSEIAYYSTASILCTTWCFVLTAIIDSLFPPIMEAHKAGNQKEYEQKNILLYQIVFYLSVAVSLAFCLLAEPIIRILYGEDYLLSVAPLRVITWYTAFSYLGMARNAWIVCENKQKYLIWVYLSAAVANVILNCVFIPLWGATGAAAASLAAQIITTMVTPLFIKPLRPNLKLMMDAILLKDLWNRLKNR